MRWQNSQGHKPCFILKNKKVYELRPLPSDRFNTPCSLLILSMPTSLAVTIRPASSWISLQFHYTVIVYSCPVGYRHNSNKERIFISNVYTFL